MKLKIISPLICKINNLNYIHWYVKDMIIFSAKLLKYNSIKNIKNLITLLLKHMLKWWTRILSFLMFKRIILTLSVIKARVNSSISKIL